MKQLLNSIIGFFKRLWYKLTRHNETPEIVNSLEETHNAFKSRKLLGTNPLCILAVGQSNMANHGEGFNYQSKRNVYRYFGGELIPAISPILSPKHVATGDQSTFLPYLGDLILENSDYDSIVFLNIAVGGSSVKEWIPGSKNFSKVAYAASVEKMLGIKFNYVLWHQGESDHLLGTSTSEYKKYFLRFKDGLRSNSIHAPIVMARTSRCAPPLDQSSERIIEAQNQLILENADIIQGPNTDILGDEFRRDGVHFNGKGIKVLGELWYKYLIKYIN